MQTFPARLLLLPILALLVAPAPAAAPPFERNDVLAMVGGADAAASDAHGYLEALVSGGAPELQLRFRNLAREGDTVFEQPRDREFPTLPDQLEAASASVVLVWFGRSEALADDADPDAFSQAYASLLARLSAVTTRLVLVTPVPFEKPPAPLLPDLSARIPVLAEIAARIRAAGAQHGLPVADLFAGLTPPPGGAPQFTSDGLQLTPAGHAVVATALAEALGIASPEAIAAAPGFDALRDAVVEKNRLWFHYARPQNWAFLGGDRVSQPSSRDHQNPEIRWFPEEMETYLPLIADAEKSIHLRASTLDAPAP
ncbi:hypothetical protein BH23VER1_BH23VER1_11180 [soil metagenome]